MKYLLTPNFSLYICLPIHHEILLNEDVSLVNIRPCTYLYIRPACQKSYVKTCQLSLYNSILNLTSIYISKKYIETKKELRSDRPAHRIIYQLDTRRVQKLPSLSFTYTKNRAQPALYVHPGLFLPSTRPLHLTLPLVPYKFPPSLPLCTRSAISLIRAQRARKTGARGARSLPLIYALIRFPDAPRAAAFPFIRPPPVFSFSLLLRVFSTSYTGLISL